MKPFDYIRAVTLDGALGLLAREREHGACLLAGGTDLIPMLKEGLIAPSHLIDIKRIAGLGGVVAEEGGGLRLGALATLAEIETSPIVRERWPALAQAAAVAATPQLRNMATLAGNLLQRPRCWYYRNRLTDCWLKGGDRCPAEAGENAFHAVLGGGPCYAVHPSDLAPALIALEAQAALRRPAGERTVPVEALYAPPEEGRRRETVLFPDEILVSVRVPRPARGSRSLFLKAMDRKAWAFALVSVAAALRLEGRRIEAARIVLGGVAPVPWRALAAEELLAGQEVEPGLLEAAAAAALSAARPLRDNGYKLPLARALVRRALEALTAEPAVTG